MIDPVPNRRNRVAWFTGVVFHPALVCIPTVALILSDLTVQAVLSWTALVTAWVTLPGLTMIALLRSRRRYVYQRETRYPVYLVIWVSVASCLVALVLLDGPVVLQVCMATLVVWLLAQFTVNALWTKISVHTAVAAGCALGLWWMGRLHTPLLVGLAVTIVVLTAWARITTRNHTRLQVVLGILIGAGSVLLVFPLLLP